MICMLGYDCTSNSESNSGRSALSAAPHHNLFGIKGQYAGQSATMATLKMTDREILIMSMQNLILSYVESLQDYVAI